MRTGPGQAPSARPGQTVTLPVEPAVVAAEEDVPPRGVPRAPQPDPAEDGLVSTRRLAWEWAVRSTDIRGTTAPPGN